MKNTVGDKKICVVDDSTDYGTGGIDSGAVTRPALLDFVSKYVGQGVARKYEWNDKGELTTTLIWIYKVQ